MNINDDYKRWGGRLVAAEFEGVYTPDVLESEKAECQGELMMYAQKYSKAAYFNSWLAMILDPEMEWRTDSRLQDHCKATICWDLFNDNQEAECKQDITYSQIKVDLDAMNPSAALGWDDPTTPELMEKICEERGLCAQEIQAEYDRVGRQRVLENGEIKATFGDSEGCMFMEALTHGYIEELYFHYYMTQVADLDDWFDSENDPSEPDQSVPEDPSEPEEPEEPSEPEVPEVPSEPEESEPDTPEPDTPEPDTPEPDTPEPDTPEPPVESESEETEEEDPIVIIDPVEPEPPAPRPVTDGDLDDLRPGWHIADEKTTRVINNAGKGMH